MSAATQLRHQVDFNLLMFKRNPAASFFTVALPLIFLFLFTSLFGNQETNGVRAATLLVPGIMALAIISATMMNLAMAITTRRERGILKRVRGTPLRPWIYIAAQAVTGVAISLVMAMLMLVIGRVVFDVSVNSSGLPTMLISILLGAASFSAMGLALTTIIPSEEAAPAITNAVALPLYFISDVFIVYDDKPAALEFVANVFPVQHLASSLNESFDPLAKGVPWPWDHWLMLITWGLFAGFVVLRAFRWTPRR